MILASNLNIYSQVLEKIGNPHYLYRMTILQAISLLAPVMGAEITSQKLLPVVITSSKDRSEIYPSIVLELV
jgi:serine/threonine-protein phosphatase 2A regulatory subunit A